MVVWLGGMDEMVLMSHRSSKSTLVANNFKTHSRCVVLVFLLQNIGIIDERLLSRKYPSHPRKYARFVDELKSLKK